ncbi:hypothetical protein FACS1894127_6880 [Clostridia bacterium]|nr:hypothetical protein FACS1894127_6880 [Clostridia bacterium]
MSQALCDGNLFMESVLQYKDVHEDDANSVRDDGGYDGDPNYNEYVDEPNVHGRAGYDSGSKGEAYEVGADSFKNPSSFWINSLKIVAVIFFVVAVMVGLAEGIGIVIGGNQLAGLITFLAVSLSAFVILAVVMVLLNLAQDIKEIRSIVGRVRRR